MRTPGILISASVGGLVLLSGGLAGPATERTREERTVTRLTGDQGWRSMKLAAPADGRPMLVDARRATFVVANSRSPKPTPAADCRHGSRPVNPYPLRVTGGRNGMMLGGRFAGQVPQDSDWRASYCNSAAILIEDTTGHMVKGVRIDGAWDAVRAGRGTNDLHLTGSWISAVRDDAIENDHLGSLTISNSLVDGAFQLVSVKPAKGNDPADAHDRLIDISGAVLRIQDYPHREGRRFGALAKSEARSPRLRLANSVVAVSSESDRTFPAYWSTGWAKLGQSSNNLFLWLSDRPLPRDLALPPTGFTVLRGEPARAAWKRARSNWIDCHPDVPRLDGDERARPEHCRRGTWGGYGR